MAFNEAKAFLEERGFGDRIMTFGVSSATVTLAAEAVGTAPEHIAKSLTFMVDGQPVMVVCAGDTKISNPKFKKYFHTKAKILTRDEVIALIGHDVGGVCPFGINPGVAVYLDNSMKRFETVYPACGNAASAVRLSIEDLERAVDYIEWIDVCKLPENVK